MGGMSLSDLLTILTVSPFTDTSRSDAKGKRPSQSIHQRKRIKREKGENGKEREHLDSEGLTCLSVCFGYANHSILSDIRGKKSHLKGGREREENEKKEKEKERERERER
jgi:hypothetical protein